MPFGLRHVAIGQLLLEPPSVELGEPARSGIDSSAGVEVPSTLVPATTRAPSPPAGLSAWSWRGEVPVLVYRRATLGA